MLKVASIGSGSSGNATLVKTDTTTLLLDCGFTLKETTSRMSQLGLSPIDIDAVLISHEHGDHIRGIGPLSRKHNVPVWLTHGTHNALRDTRFSSAHLLHAHKAFSIGDINIDPFPTPHDAAESCQYIFEHAGARFACVTDLGISTPHVESKLVGVNALIVECNYDEEMLKNGPYPASLQARIRGNFGHLGNEQAGELIKKLDHDCMQSILLGHLSEQNNTAEVAEDTIKAYLHSRHERITVLEQHACSTWFEISASPAGIASAAKGSATIKSDNEPVVNSEAVTTQTETVQEAKEHAAAEAAREAESAEPA